MKDKFIEAILEFLITMTNC